MSKLKLICPKCKSDNVSVRTEVRWDYSTQTWVPWCLDFEVSMECLDCDELVPFEFSKENKDVA
jgi:hypothetical protein